MLTDTIELRNRNLSCTIVPSLGGALARLDMIRRDEVHHILRPTPPDLLKPDIDPRALSLVHYAPLVGSVYDNVIKWDSKQYPLKPNLPDMPHFYGGIAWQKPFKGKRDGKTAATLSYFHKKADGWPFDFSLNIVYDLEEDNLTITYELVNESQSLTIPLGIGTGMVFNKARHAHVTAGIKSFWKHNEAGAPALMDTPPFNLDLKEGQDISEIDTDERFFSEWTGRATIDYPDSRMGITIKAPPPFKHLGFSSHKQDSFFRFSTLSHVSNVLNIKGYDEDETGLFIGGPADNIIAKMKIDIDMSAF